MNYLTEINSFYNWLIENPIPANAQALWHRLMAYCNAFCWRSEFTITNSRLAEELSISRQELDRIRNVLCQKERIVYEKGTGNKCGTYHIIPFVSEKAPNLVIQSCHKFGTSLAQSCHNAVTSLAESDTQSLPLNKLKEIKLNINKRVEGHAPTFQQPTIAEIAEYCDERKSTIDPEKFFAYYQSNGWKVGKNSMKDWKMAVITWEKRGFESSNSSGKSDGTGSSQTSYDLDELNKYWDEVPALKFTK